MNKYVKPVVVILVCGSAALSVESAFKAKPISKAECDKNGELVETFVLTPINETSFSLTVPAELCGPVTNNSCHDWSSHIEKCYLPGRRLETSVAQSQPALTDLLDRQISATVGAWKPGVLPSDGQSIDMPLMQYYSCVHLWLTHRAEIRQTVGHCWLDGHRDPLEAIARASTQPAASIAVEVFGGTRDAKGYPIKSKF